VVAQTVLHYAGHHVEKSLDAIPGRETATRFLECSGISAHDLCRQDDLDAVVLLVPEGLVASRVIFELRPMRNDEARIDLASLDAGENSIATPKMASSNR
jgi:hypothetical protein